MAMRRSDQDADEYAFLPVLFPQRLWRSRRTKLDLIAA